MRPAGRHYVAATMYTEVFYNQTRAIINIASISTAADPTAQAVAAARQCRGRLALSLDAALLLGTQCQLPQLIANCHAPALSD